MGYSASLFTLLHLYYKHELHSAEDIYKAGLTLGFDYQSNGDVVNLINAVTGGHTSVQSEQIESTLTNGESSYKSYYWMHRMGGNDLWYNVGQMLSTHLEAIGAAGYRSIISFRGDHEPTARLPSDPTTGPVDNHEFNDEAGYYSIALEGNDIDQVLDTTVQFFSLPIPSSSTTNPWTKDRFEAYLPSLRAAAARGPVVSHCATGYRSGAFTLTYLAYEAKHCSNWVFTAAEEIGFDYTSDDQVVSFVKEILGC